MALAPIKRMHQRDN